MRIAICTDQYLPLISGLVDSVDTVAAALRAHGHTVRIYAPTISGCMPDRNVYRFPSWSLPGSGNGITFALPLGAMRDMRAFAPDVIHTELFGSVGWLAVWAARRLRVPLVGTDHTFPADFLRYAKLDFSPFPYLARAYAAFYYNHCDFITAPSERVINELRSHGCKRPSVVLSNPVQGIFKPLPEKDSLKRKFGIGQRAVLIFGRLAPEKNIDTSLEVFAAAVNKTDTDLVIIGDGPLKNSLLKKVVSLSISQKVKFLGTMRGENLVEAINACEIYLITSTSETQSMTTIQALACGLPVVAARSGGLVQYVQDGTTGYLIDPKSVAEYVNKTVHLLTNAPLRESMGRAAVESVRAFSPDAIATQFEHIYTRLIRQYGHSRKSTIGTLV